MNSSLKRPSLQDMETLLDYFPKGIVFLDLETTGLSPLVDRIIEIAALKIIPAKNQEKGHRPYLQGETHYFETLVNPKIEIPQHTIDIHHITNEMVKDSPTITEPIRSFTKFVGDLPLVAHNAQFDIGFLAVSQLKNGVSFEGQNVFDSCRFARGVFKNSPDYKLGTLAKYLGIDLENHHRAMDDTYACFKIFVSALRLLKKTYMSEELHLQSLNKHALAYNLAELKRISLEELPKHLAPLNPLIRSQQKIEICYTGGTVPGEFRPVKPISFLPLPRGLVLYALCLKEQKHKSFLVRKIKSFRELATNKDY